MMLKMTVEDYIQHINPFKEIFSFRFRPELLPTLQHPLNKHIGWDYHARIQLEFNLLYRWHALVPDTVADGTGKQLTSRGIGRILKAAVKQPAHAFGARCASTLDLLGRTSTSIDQLSIEHGRNMRLQSYNAYCERFSLPARKTFSEINKDPGICDALRKAYPQNSFETEADAVNKVEYYVGVMNEQVQYGIFPPLLLRMVLAHAMKGIYSNDLCRPENWNKDKFLPDDTKYIAWNEIQTHTLANMIARNTLNDSTPIKAEDVYFTVV